MIRRDYILRMIAEFAEALRKIQTMRRMQQWQEAELATDEQFERLIGTGAGGVADLSEAELLARLMKGESTHAVRTRLMMVLALLAEAGDQAMARGQIEARQRYYLKALQLLLDPPQSVAPGDTPEFVPKVDILLAGLSEFEFPTRTRALLMRHYECSGQFSKAEDELFKILDESGGDAGTLEFGVNFYQRLQSHRDKDLDAGNLPRAEVDAGLAEMLSRRQTIGK